MGALRLLPGSHGGAQALLREGEVTGGDRQRIEGEFKDNQAQEEAGRQYLNSWGEEINKLGEANDKFNKFGESKQGSCEDVNNNNSNFMVCLCCHSNHPSHFLSEIGRLLCP